MHAKGKGLMQTYWITKITNAPGMPADASEHHGSEYSSEDQTNSPEERVAIGLGTEGELHIDRKSVV